MPSNFRAEYVNGRNSNVRYPFLATLMFSQASLFWSRSSVKKIFFSLAFLIRRAMPLRINKSSVKADLWYTVIREREKLVGKHGVLRSFDSCNELYGGLREVAVESADAGPTFLLSRLKENAKN